MENDKNTAKQQEADQSADAKISQEEMTMLENLDNEPGSDDANRVNLDSTDADGTKLNEKAGKRSEAGGDLDVPGAELDDANEDIGEEDEENNSYSQADTN